MIPAWKRWGWPLAKLVLAAAILFFVGRQFYNDLTQESLQDLAWRPGWLALSAALYLGFLASSCWYWRRLMRHFGQEPALLLAYRAYFVSQFGKYVPGKALALVIRGMMVRGPKVSLGLAMLTSLYEVLTTMAAGALLAAIALALEPPVVIEWDMPPVLLGLILLGVCGVPLMPMVFNRLASGMAKKLQTEDSGAIPKIDLGTLLLGIATTGWGWCLLGLSVWAGLAAVLPEPPPLDVSVWLRSLGAIGLAYVGGFLAVFLPSGVGVREGILLVLLRSLAPSALIAAAVLLMRVAWTLAELILAGLLYTLRPSPPDSTK